MILYIPQNRTIFQIYCNLEYIFVILELEEFLRRCIGAGIKKLKW
ncbi:MAG: hypothetical protein UW09_C0001G0292 [candidate division TM6 bacterium GW2011_GWF2_43_87]|nr:MAG: hypothetical protein UW09_C0001G0292 [candidate division TM6 bacterium GW2011_GWF2_43_87]